jgi:hypothetical protein
MLRWSRVLNPDLSCFDIRWKYQQINLGRKGLNPKNRGNCYDSASFYG